MGGFGSGSYVRLMPRHARVEEMRRFDLADLRRRGYLSGDVRLMKWITRAGRPAVAVGIVALESGVLFLWRTAPNAWHRIEVGYCFSQTSFGFKRWFCCPRCHQRARVLHWQDHPGQMACRKCYDLRYSSQSEEPRWRADRRAYELRSRLGSPDPANQEFPTKPPKMRRCTYEALRAQHDEFRQIWAQGMCDALSAMNRRAHHLR